MFTGIIVAKGTSTVSQRGDGFTLSIKVSENSKAIFNDIEIGESISVNGVCLTVESFNKKNKQLMFFVSEETCKKTNLATLQKSKSNLCNLEKALRLSDRLSGHLVQGHVDCVGRCLKLEKNHEAYDLCVEIPTKFKKYISSKGSITIDGISLTINTIRTKTKSVEVNIKIIPHTYTFTNLSNRKKGDLFNVETDVISKYLEGLLSKK